MLRLDTRATLAADLARINGQLAAVSRDAPGLDFQFGGDLTAFRTGLDSARREVTALELKIHDLILGVRVTAS